MRLLIFFRSLGKVMQFISDENEHYDKMSLLYHEAQITISLQRMNGLIKRMDELSGLLDKMNGKKGE